MSTAIESDANILSVGDLTRQIKDSLETAFPAVWVAGEVSNFSRPQSGHCYFSLKDDQAQLRAVMWKGVASRLQLDLHDGLEIVCRGHLDVYPPRGSYQLVVEQLSLQGVGALEAALRRLREKLEREGLFQLERKRRLPAAPKRIAVVTSPTGAAVRDFLNVLRRRWKGIHIQIFATRVQGAEAASEIAAAIQAANRVQPRPDVVVVTRGGGSLEDLWCFNDERVVRAVANSEIPTISAIGHEIDVTLSDLAADVRALTPSEAAERVAPSADDMRELLINFGARLRASLAAQLKQNRRQVEALASRPVLLRPEELVTGRARQIDQHATRLHRAARSYINDQSSRMAACAASLQALSPLAVLGRGYSVTQDAATNNTITDARRLRPGDQITTRFHHGAATSRVEEVGP